MADLGKYVQVAGPLLVILLLLGTLCAAAVRRSYKVRANGSGGDWVDGLSWCLAAMCLALTLIAAAHPLIRGTASGKWDADGQFLPYFTIVSDHIKHGQLVTWDLWTNSGAPLMGDPQAGALSPIVLALGLVAGQPSQGFVFYWLFSWWLGGLGVLILGRHFGAPVWGSFAVAIGFLFCGVYESNAEHTSWVVGLSFVPWLLWRLDVALRSGSFLAAAQAGAIWGLQGLAAHPSIVLLTACYAVLWALGRTVRGSDADIDWDARGSLLRVLLLTLVVILVGAAIFSPTYGSFFFDGAGVHNRTGMLGRADALGDEFPPGALATLASPELIWVKVKEGLWESTDVSMINAYVGVFIPLAGLTGLILAPRSPWRWWLAGLALLSFACAMGESLPLRGWLYDLLPPMRFFHHSAVFRLFGIMSLTVLALVALNDVDKLVGDPSRSRRRLILYVAAAVCFLATIALTAILTTRSLTGQMLLAIVHPAVVWGALLIIAAFVYRCNSVARRSSGISMLLLLVVSDGLISSALAIPTVMELGSTRWRDLDAQHVSSVDQTGRGLFRKASACDMGARCKKNDQLITKIPVLDGYSSDKSPWRIATAADPILRSSAVGSNRIWFTPVATSADLTDSDFARFRQRAHVLGRVPIVRSDAAQPTAESTTHSSGPGTVESAPAAVPLPAAIVRYTPRELVFNVRTPSAGWLLITDRWSPRWGVSVNGAQQRAHLANFIFRAVEVNAGPNTVSFRYAPWAFPWLILLSWVTLFGILGWGICEARRPTPHDADAFVAH